MKAKEAFIPDASQERKPRDPLEFIRNVWGNLKLAKPFNDLYITKVTYVMYTHIYICSENCLNRNLNKTESR